MRNIGKQENSFYMTSTVNTSCASSRASTQAVADFISI